MFASCLRGLLSVRLALQACVLLLALGAATPSVAALPNPLASSTAEKVDAAALERSLSQVIQTLENDKQRADLLAKLKQLQEVTATEKARDPGVIGILGDAIGSIEQQFRGDDSPWARWKEQLQLAKEELIDRLPSWSRTPAMLLDFVLIILLWAALALGLGWLVLRLRERMGLGNDLPDDPGTRDLMVFALSKIGPWALAFIIMLVLSVSLPASLSKTLAMVMAYALVVGTVFSAICVIAFSLLNGPHRRQAIGILRRQAFRPLWLIGSLAALGEAGHDLRLEQALGENLAACMSAGSSSVAALLTGIFVLRFRRPIGHLLRNQSLEKRLRQRGINDLRNLIGTLWFIPVLLLVGTSLIATFISVGDSNTALTQALVCAALLVVAMAAITLLKRASEKVRLLSRRSAPYIAQLKSFVFTLLHLSLILIFIEIGLRVWGFSLLRHSDEEGGLFSTYLLSFGLTVLGAWLVWILADTAIQHMLGVNVRGKSNTRALTMLPLIRNVMMVTIGLIALIVALANMGVNVTPLLAGAGVLGLAIGFGAQTLVSDLITGLFIIIEDSLAIDDYVDVGGHLGTVEALTIRTVRLRDLDGVVHTVPFSEIKTIKNYSRQFGFAMFRWPVPAYMAIDQAMALVRDVAQELKLDRNVARNIWSPLEMQGIESFDNGQAVLRFRFKTAPIKQWEVQRAFNLILRRKLDQSGLEPAMPRLNVQLTRPRKNTLVDAPEGSSEA